MMQPFRNIIPNFCLSSISWKGASNLFFLQQYTGPRLLFLVHDNKQAIGLYGNFLLK